MPGVGHGGPRKGTKSFERKQNAEAQKHALLLETHIESPTDPERDAIRAMVARNARTTEESEMFLSMLLGDDA